MTICGVVLAAGAGTRFGGPKALARTAAGEPWLALAVGTLRAAGCEPVVVVLGTGADEAEPLVPAGAVVVRVADGRRELSASVRLGLEAAGVSGAVAALLVPVDVPELPASACRRMMRDADADALRQAVYRGRPGHPVLIGRAHVPRVAGALTGDSGAGAYLRAHGAERVECADLWHGRDRDTSD
ncbi:hypothetical protein HMPREF1529_01034 [Microbacterium sp. oral taxon 186 str. F0373]|uniref:nucleotidyltransferase family protein n=1 Tax=Microbacterium sp. oral taxon 186 TaxID=712383 RepID=UPI00034E27F7|nr:nucleotidyltransferase family protein [Microbacterium sp. oral taxon 186]EPD84432.1 hypothetical protein HMPREF1529_01034 [Microbacterium sp. oral taxon 186 str. F0373]